MTSKKSKGSAGGSTPNGPLKQNDHLARGSIRNLNCAAHAVKLDTARKRALIDLVMRLRRGATLQLPAERFHVGRIDVARLLAKFSRRNYRGELIFFEEA